MQFLGRFTLQAYDFDNPLLVNAEILRGSVDAAKELGIDIDEALSANGITVPMLMDSKGFVAYHQVVNFLEDVALQHACPLFGFYVGKHQPPLRFGLMAQLPKLCATIGDSLEKGLKYSQLYNQESQWESEIDAAYVFMKRRHRVSFPGAQTQLHILAVTLMIKASAVITGGAREITSISFSHSRPENADVLKRYFEVPVYFDQDYDGYTFPEVYLHHPLASSNPELLEIVELHFDSLLSDSLVQQGLGARVDQVIRKNLGTNACTIEGVSQLMRKHPRALQRSLKKEGLNFRDMLNKVRQETAEHYLRASDIRLADLSDMLGYKNVGNFSRAFKILTGLSPDIWKENNRRR